MKARMAGTGFLSESVPLKVASERSQIDQTNSKHIPFYSSFSGQKHKSRGRFSSTPNQNSFGDSFIRVIRGRNML